MKLTQNGLALLAGIVRSCMAKRAEEVNCQQLAFSVNPKMVSMEKFRQVFPLELETAERLILFSRNLKKENIDEEAVALFFGGEDHINYALKDIRDQGLRNGMAKIFLIFHMMLPVKITREKNNSYTGLYVNQGIVIVFKNLQLIPCGDEQFEVGQSMFIHYGYIVRLANKKLCQAVLDEQSDNTRFIDACMRTYTIDCGKLLSSFHLMRRR